MAHEAVRREEVRETRGKGTRSKRARQMVACNLGSEKAEDESKKYETQRLLSQGCEGGARVGLLDYYKRRGIN